jgi:hypothetical protein
MANVLVSGAGTEACNGLYIGSGSGQEAVYTGPNGYFIQYDGVGAWVLWDEFYNALYCDDWMGNTNPWDAASWQGYMAGAPAPTVTEVSGFSISGTIQLADTTPVKNVKVTATASGEDDVVTYTDENGDYTLENLKDETTWRVTPTKLGCTFSPTYHDVTLSGANQSGKDFTATLTGHNVSGTVADAGTGVAGATVSATDGVNVVEAETDEYGAYTLENLPDDEWTLTVEAAGRNVFWASRTLSVSGADLEQVDFVAIVPRGYFVSGAGDSTFDGLYQAVGTHNDKPYYKYSNRYLYYSASLLAWRVAISNTGFLPDDYSSYYNDDPDAPDEGTWYNNVNWNGRPPAPSVTPGGSECAVTGTILDGSSNPVPGVLITATASGESDVTAYTGPDGKYAIGGLTDSTTWRLTPTKTGWTFTETYEDVEVSGADETGVDFEGEEEGGEEVITMAISAYEANKILDHINGKTAYTMPAHLYMAAFVTDPSTGGSEVSGGGYARVELDPADWEAAADGVAVLAGNVDFPVATGNWGTVSYLALFDAAEGGHILRCTSLLDTTQAIGYGDTLRIPAGTGFVQTLGDLITGGSGS